jgi:hypothetical protein
MSRSDNIDYLGKTLGHERLSSCAHERKRHAPQSELEDDCQSKRLENALSLEPLHKNMKFGIPTSLP